MSKTLILKCTECATYYHIKNKDVSRKDLKERPCPNCGGKQECIALKIIKEIYD